MNRIDMKGTKSFWQRPEGIPGALILLTLIGFGGYGLMKIMPDLILLAENIYYLGAMCLGLFVAGYVLLDKRVRTLIWYFYKSIIRKATGIFIQLDPIAIIEGFLDDLHSKMKDMENQMGKLKGQIRKVKEKIKKREENRDTFFKLANAARNQGKKSMMDLNNRKAMREEEVIKNFTVLLRKTEKLYQVLSKMKKYSSIMVEDIAHEIEIKKLERETIRNSHKIMKSAVNIINGNSDRKVMFDQAMEFIVDDIGMRIGEMERFMDVSADFMDNMDLENAMYEEEGLKQLDEWSAKVDEKFNASTYESPVKALEAGNVEFAEKQKVKVVQTPAPTRTNSSSKSTNESKYF